MCRYLRGLPAGAIGALICVAGCSQPEAAAPRAQVDPPRVSQPMERPAALREKPVVEATPSPRILPAKEKRKETKAPPVQVVQTESPVVQEEDPRDRLIEKLEWRVIQASTNAHDFAKYLAKYPHGEFAPLARQSLLLLTQLKAPEPAPPLPALVPIEPKRDDMTRLAGLVRGRGVLATAPRKIGPGVQRVAVVASDGTMHPWHAQLPAAWRADAVELTVLALMIDTEFEFVESISYRGQVIPRYRQVLHIEMLEARSGARVKRHVFWAEAPLRPSRDDVLLPSQLVGQVPLGEVLAWIQDDVVVQNFGPRLMAPTNGPGFYYDPNASKKNP